MRHLLTRELLSTDLACVTGDVTVTNNWSTVIPPRGRGMGMESSTALQVLYVEDDPALRGILSTLLGGRQEIQVTAVGSSSEALAMLGATTFDVALLDLSLGDASLTGLELALELRRLQPQIGIVLLTQHKVPTFLARVKEGQRLGWSFLLKRADLHPRYLVDVLKASARGLNVIDPEILEPTTTETAVEQLSARQVEVMSLAATGLDANAISERLGITPSAARQDLSRSYAVLVPDPPAGADLRTLAVLRYLRETRQ